VAARNRDELPERVYFCAFGKHPGWDDHIPDIGLETDRLVYVRRMLYAEGIGKIINTAAWDKLPADERLEGFSHLFLWRSPGEMVVGRLWTSSDGKGRSQYPMVVAAQCRGLSFGWIMEHVPPRLEELHRQCVGTTAAAEVQASVERTREELRRAAASAPEASADPEVAPQALAGLVNGEALGGQGQGLLRILYDITRQSGARFAPGEPAAPGESSRPWQIRLPAVGESPADIGATWLGLLLSQIDPATPVLLLLRLPGGPVDALVGDPAPDDFFCLRASTRAIPPASEIPYAFEEEFVSRSSLLLDQWRCGKIGLPLGRSSAPPPAAGNAGGAGAALLAAVGAGWRALRVVGRWARARWRRVAMRLRQFGRLQAQRAGPTVWLFARRLRAWFGLDAEASAAPGRSARVRWIVSLAALALVTILVLVAAKLRFKR
jgi:hypothetical protein